MLLAAGADVNKKGYEGKSLIEWTRDGDFNQEITDLFL